MWCHEVDVVNVLGLTYSVCAILALHTVLEVIRVTVVDHCLRLNQRNPMTRRRRVSDKDLLVVSPVEETLLSFLRIKATRQKYSSRTKLLHEVCSCPSVRRPDDNLTWGLFDEVFHGRNTIIDDR